LSQATVWSLEIKQPFKKQRDVAKLKENDVAVNYVTEMPTRHDSQQHG